MNSRDHLRSKLEKISNRSFNLFKLNNFIEKHKNDLDALDTIFELLFESGNFNDHIMNLVWNYYKLPYQIDIAFNYINSSVNFIAIANNKYDRSFINSCFKTPDQKQELLKLLIAPENFKHLVKNFKTLEFWIKYFDDKNQKAQIFEQLILAQNFQRIANIKGDTSSHTLYKIGNIFETETNKLFEQFIKSSHLMDKINDTCLSSLCSTFETPLQMNIIFTLYLQPKNLDQLSKIDWQVKVIKDYDKSMIASKKQIQNHILQYFLNPDKFDQFVKSKNVCDIAAAYSEEDRNNLFLPLLLKNFNRLINSKEMLNGLRDVFPQQNIFRQPTLNLARSIASFKLHNHKNGAVFGMFSNFFPRDTSNLISRDLDIQSGGRVASTCKEANENARLSLQRS